MKVKELMRHLSAQNPESEVIVKSGKYGFGCANSVVPGFFSKLDEAFNADVEEQGGTDSVLIES